MGSGIYSHATYTAPQHQAKIIPLSGITRIGFDHKLIIHTTQEILCIDHADIAYCEADGNYTTIHYVDGRKIIVSKCLKNICELLGSQSFVRIHQSYLVSIAKISIIASKEVELKDGRRLPLSRRCRKLLIRQLP